MSPFVEECRKEWSRLGVPEVEANEMASDLEADLAEARADGASPEEVLGNGYFDAKTFAASWATARGFVSLTPSGRGTIRIRSLVLALSALVGAVVAGVGFLILVAPRSSSQAFAAPFAQRFNRPLPSNSGEPSPVPLRGTRQCHRSLGMGLVDCRAVRARRHVLDLAPMVESSGQI